MDYVKLGNTGLDVSQICLGAMSFGSAEGWAHNTWALDEEDSRAIIKKALDLGVNFFDTANVYAYGNSEKILGRALKDFVNRDEVVIATKVYNPTSEDPNHQGLSRLHIMRAIENSLRRLGTDYVDLYQIHRWDYDTPIEETLATLHELIKSGKVRYIGASSMYAWQFAKALCISDNHGWTRFISMQNHYNLAYREEEREMMPLCCSEGIGVIPWSPLARGLLTGNRSIDGIFKTTRAESDDYGHNLYFRETDFKIAERVNNTAKKLNTTPAKIALAWLLKKPGITAPIIGASKIEHLDDAVGALNIQLSKEDIEYLEELYLPHPILGHN